MLVEIRGPTVGDTMAALAIERGNQRSQEIDIPSNFDVTVLVRHRASKNKGGYPPHLLEYTTDDGLENVGGIVNVAIVVCKG